MTNKSTFMVSGIAGIAAIAAGLLSVVPTTHADTEWHVDTGAIQVGTNSTAGNAVDGSGFRWKYTIQTPGGAVETPEFIMSMETAYEYLQTFAADFQSSPQKLHTILKNTEVRFKSGHVGIGTEGIQIGNNPDQQLKDVFRAGAYVFLELLGEQKGLLGKKSEFMTFDARTGYSWDQFTSMVGEKKSRNLVEEVLAFKFSKGTFEVGANTRVGFNVSREDGVSVADDMLFGAETFAGFHMRPNALRFDSKSFASASQLEFALLAKLSYLRDNFRKQINADPDAWTASVVLEVRHRTGHHVK